MSDYQMFEVQVSQVEPLTEQVKRFTLEMCIRDRFQPFQGTPDNLHFKYHLLVTF